MLLSQSTRSSVGSSIASACASPHRIGSPGRVRPCGWTVLDVRIDRLWEHSEVNPWPETAATASISPRRSGGASRKEINSSTGPRSTAVSRKTPSGQVLAGTSHA